MWTQVRSYSFIHCMLCECCSCECFQSTTLLFTVQAAGLNGYVCLLFWTLTANHRLYRCTFNDCCKTTPRATLGLHAGNVREFCVDCNTRKLSGILLFFTEICNKVPFVLSFFLLKLQWGLNVHRSLALFIPTTERKLSINSAVISVKYV